MNKNLIMTVLIFFVFGLIISSLSIVPIVMQGSSHTAEFRFIFSVIIFSSLGIAFYYALKKYLPELYCIIYNTTLEKENISTGDIDMNKSLDDIDMSNDSFLDTDDDMPSYKTDNIKDVLYIATSQETENKFDPNKIGSLDESFGFFTDDNNSESQGGGSIKDKFSMNSSSANREIFNTFSEEEDNSKDVKSEFSKTQAKDLANSIRTIIFKD